MLLLQRSIVFLVLLLGAGWLAGAAAAHDHPSGGDVDRRAAARAVSGKLELESARSPEVTRVDSVLSIESVLDDPATVGTWTAPFQVPAKSIHATVLPTGKVLWFSYPVNEVGSDAWLWDPVTGATTNVSLTVYRDLFCVAQSFLADGRLFATGGHVPGGAYGDGVKNTNFFDPSTNRWTAGPDLSIERWYPTNVELGNGNVLIFGGSKDTATTADTVDLYDAASNTMKRLPDTATKKVNNYPRMHLLPSGKLANTNAKGTTFFDPATNSWSFVANMNFGGRGQSDMSVLLPGLSKVLEAGGTNSTSGVTNTAEIIDFSQAKPRWRYTASMNNPRMYANAVTLADGTVLMVGGGRGPGIYDNPVYNAELFDPVSETWTVMAAQKAPRIYHSTAVLLPDGRVVSAGQDKGSYQFTAEIYSPPYLFKGARPSITTAPTALGYDQQFSISTPDASSIKRVALVRPGAATHSINFDQRYVDLSFTVKNAGTLTATSPRSANHAPPGPYMLFILSSSGVPSIAQWVEVRPAARPAPTITSFNPTSGRAGTSVTIAGANFTGATSVSFAGVAASFTVNSASQITAIVPKGATTGPISVTTPDGTGTSSSDFVVTSAPTITSFDPTVGAVGTSVVIAGSGFTGATSVTFAGVSATFTLDSDTQVTATVPRGATTGRIAVTTPQGTATSSSDFTVTSTSAPVVTSFDPTSGKVGTSVTIAGANFTGATSVTFAGVAASFTLDSASQITAIVPRGATTGRIAVTAPNGTGTSSSDFVVTTYRGTVLGDGPGGYWRLAETTGNALDETRNAAGGTYANGVTRGVDGALVTEPNPAARFDGLDDYVSVPDNNALDVGDVFTYEAWVKRGATQGTTQRFLHKGAGPAALGFGTSNKIVLIPGGSSTTAIASSTTTITDHTWHHIVATKNGPNVHIYVDRVDVTGPVTNTTLTNNATALNIGRATGGSGYFDGDIDEVAIYPVALTAAQVLNHYQAR
ncbi:MAG: DUF1929 domain-containing protein [Actinomycetota bacterium]|nr:DUF1929 domain-containing protein [Actinomycetota bacterium]